MTADLMEGGFKATSYDSLNKRMQLKQMPLGLIKQPANGTVIKLLCSITSSIPELEGSGCSVDTNPSNARSFFTYILLHVLHCLVPKQSGSP